MQSLFYMTEEGDAQTRVGRLNLALKRYHMLFKVISTLLTENFLLIYMAQDVRWHGRWSIRFPCVYFTEIYHYNILAVRRMLDCCFFLSWLDSKDWLNWKTLYARTLLMPQQHLRLPKYASDFPKVWILMGLRQVYIRIHEDPKLASPQCEMVVYKFLPHTLIQLL